MKNLMTLILGLSFSLSAFAAANIFLDAQERDVRNKSFATLAARAAMTSSGADIVGNGGGIAEQNMRYAYTMLAKSVNYCLVLPQCGESDNQLIVLEKIYDIARRNQEREENILFLSDKNFNDIFRTDLDFDHRVAKTGFSSEFPIFVNIDQIYEAELENDLSAMIGILVHEVGHQAGVASHSFLDALASEVRTAFFRAQVVADTVVGTSKVSLSLIGGLSAYDNQERLLFVGDKKVTLNEPTAVYVCHTPGTKLVASRLMNPAWGRAVAREGGLMVRLRADVDYYCQRGEKGFVFIEQAQVDYRFLFQISVKPTRVSELEVLDQELRLRTSLAPDPFYGL